MSALISKSRTKKSRERARSGTKSTTRKSVTPFGLFIVALLWFSVMWLLHTGRAVSYTTLAPGQRAPATVIAETDFMCPDLGLTELNRREAADTVAPVFSVNYRPLQTALRSLDKLFDRLLRIRANAETENATIFELQISDVIDLLGIPLTADEVAHLAPPGKEEEVLAGIKRALNDVWDRGISSDDGKDTAFLDNVTRGHISLVRTEERGTIELTVDQLLRPREATDTALSIIQQNLGENTPSITTLKSLIAPWMQQNILYDQRTTDALRETAADAVAEESMTVPRRNSPCRAWQNGNTTNHRTIACS